MNGTEKARHLFDPDMLIGACGNDEGPFVFSILQVTCDDCRNAGQKPAADGAGTAPPPDDLNRCALCGWTLAPSAKEGCVRGNCSLRPLPNHFYAPERARAEYAPHLDNDPRAARGRRVQDQEPQP